MATISFARGIPAPECLPVAELADCARGVIERDGETVLNYGPVGGYPPLRGWAGARHGVEPAQVLVTNGSLQALSLLAGRQITSERCRVFVEAPTYDRALHIIERHAGEPVLIPTDEDGLDVDAVARALDTGPPPAFLYTIPTFQNPSGCTLSLDRRRRLAELARTRGLLIVEDDPYTLVRFDGEPLPTLYELAEGEGVVYSTSFSKTVSPGLRVGYVVGSLPLIARLESLAVQTYLAPVFLAQATVLEFLARGLFEPNLERVGRLLRLRRDAMLGALERELPEGCSWSRPAGGYFVWVDFPQGTDAAELQQRAERAHVTFVKGADCFPPGAGGERSARLAYSFVSPDAIAAGIATLGALLREPNASAVTV